MTISHLIRVLREEGDLRRLHGKPSTELAAHMTKISQNTWAKGSDSGEMVETVKMPSTIQHFGMSDISAGQHKTLAALECGTYGKQL